MHQNFTIYETYDKNTHNEYGDWANNLKKGLSIVLEVDQNRIILTKIYNGSVIVEYKIEPTIIKPWVILKNHNLTDEIKNCLDKNHDMIHLNHQGDGKYTHGDGHEVKVSLNNKI